MSNERNLKRIAQFLDTVRYMYIAAFLFGFLLILKIVFL